MPNELVHKYLTEAVRDYDQLDTHHDGRLNFVDIARYEKLGPKQKAVGQFLENNVYLLSGISEAQPMTGDREVEPSDLVFASLYSSSDQKAKDNATNNDALAAGIAGGVAGAAFAIIPALPVIGISSFGGPIAAGAAGLAVEGSAAAAGYTLGSSGERASIKERERKIDSLRP